MIKIEDQSINLTQREFEVLKLLAEGYTSKQISFILHISEVTVVFHRQNLKHKFDAKNSNELINMAHKLRILD